MRDGLAGKGELVPTRLHLEIQPRFSVTDPLAFCVLRIEAATVEEHVLPDRLVAAPDAGIFVGNDQVLRSQLQTEQGVRAISHDPRRWLAFPYRKHPSGDHPDAWIERERLQQLGQHLPIGDHVVVGVIQHTSARMCRGEVARVVHARPRLMQIAHVHGAMRLNLSHRRCGVVGRVVVDHDDLVAGRPEILLQEAMQRGAQAPRPVEGRYDDRELHNVNGQRDHRSPRAQRP